MELKIETSGKTWEELEEYAKIIKKTTDMRMFTLLVSGSIKSQAPTEQLSAPLAVVDSSSVSLVEIGITRTDSRGVSILWELGANPDLSGEVSGIDQRSGTIAGSQTLTFETTGPPIGSFYIRATEMASGYLSGVSDIEYVDIAQPTALANPAPTATPKFNAVELSFTEDINASNYRIEKKSGLGAFSVVTESAVSPYLVEELSAGTTYTFRVTAVSDNISYTSTSAQISGTPTNNPDIIPFDLAAEIALVSGDADPTIVLESGKIYFMETYSTINLTHDLTIVCNDGVSALKWGKDYYNQWRESGESQFIFNLGQWNKRIRIQNVNLMTGLLLDQIQPWYRTLFTNSTTPVQTGTIELINSETSLELGLLYSGSQYNYLTVDSRDIIFEGVIWQELKANNGGGLLSKMLNCELTQIDPITYFQANLSFEQGLVTSDVSFDLIENIFQDLPGSNASNILYFDNISFFLPAGLEDNQFTHAIRTIPVADDVISMDIVQYSGIKYLRSNTHELQVGDVISIAGTQYTIQVKDRASFINGFPSFKWVEYALSSQPPQSVGPVNVTIISSIGESLLGAPARSGYMIFKDNRNWQTNLISQPSLFYMLASNPFGVLSYNNKEITAYWENVNHNGFYRQTSSGVGSSNGYTLKNCTGFGDEFNPDVPVTYL